MCSSYSPICRPSCASLFPYTTLFRSVGDAAGGPRGSDDLAGAGESVGESPHGHQAGEGLVGRLPQGGSCGLAYLAVESVAACETGAWLNHEGAHAVSDGHDGREGPPRPAVARVGLGVGPAASLPVPNLPSGSSENSWVAA